MRRERGSTHAAARQACSPAGPFLFSEGLRHADEEAAAFTPLRRSDADAGAAAQLVFSIEQVEHVGADAEAFERARAAEVLRNAGVEHPVSGQRAAIRDHAVGVVGSKA